MALLLSGGSSAGKSKVCVFTADPTGTIKSVRKDVVAKNCYSCENPMKEPILLPCRHVVCTFCLKREFLLARSSTVVCPQCKQDFPVGYEYSLSDESERARYTQHQSFKRHFNAFFVRILTDLVFNGTGEPEPRLLRQILSYVTLDMPEGRGPPDGSNHERATKQFSPYSDVSLIDPTPVIRSFLLQLLLQSSKGTVDDYVTDYFNRSLAVVRSGNNSRAHHELCVLFISCMEDYIITEELNPTIVTDLSAFANQYVVPTLKRGGPVWCTFSGSPITLSASSLGTIAAVRVSLSIAADLIYKETSMANTGVLSADVVGVIGILQQMLDHAELNCRCLWLRRFLAKQIIRKHGASSIHTALAVPALGFILPMDIRELAASEVLIDYFVIENELDVYFTLRNALSACIVEGKVDGFDKCFQTIDQPNAMKNALLAMTICSVVTRSYFNHGPAGLPKLETMNMLINYISGLPHITSKDFAIKLLKNSLPGELALRNSSGIQNAMVALLVCRLWILLMHYQPNGVHLISPLSEFIANPQSMKNKFFPTMPHDQIQDVKEVMRGLATQAYECPNGHVYYIGDCGKPFTLGNCHCGGTIGGTGHQAAAGNRPFDVTKDSTKPGHILGPVSAVLQQGAAAAAVRDLSPTAGTILRAILHMTLYASAAANGPEKVAALIDPLPADVLGFLWRHIFNDLTALQHALGKSLDDCIVFLHAIVGNLPASASQGDCSWDTQPGRRQWEASVQTSLIAPFMQMLVSGESSVSPESGHLFACNCAILSVPRTPDDAAAPENNYSNRIAAGLESIRADANKSSSTAALMRLLEESEAPADVAGSLLDDPAVWRYRESPSVEHLAIQLENLCSSSKASLQSHSLPSGGCPEAADDRYVCLQKFLHSRHALATINYLPDIVSLTALLHQEYSRRLDASAVASLSIDKFVKIHGNRFGHTLRPLVENFIEAWNAVHDHLRRHRFWFRGRQYQAPEDACAHPMTFDSPLRMLLVGRRGLALCPVALATYLGKLHNEFLEVYSQAKKEGPSFAVSLPDVRVAHLIAVDLQADLFPIILANCEYSFKVGEGTLLQYNFDAIQHQIMDRFVSHKPMLNLPGHMGNANELQSFVLREDVTHGGQLEKLSKIIPQELIRTDVKDKIVREYRGNVMDLTDSLVLIDQVIGFLVATNVPGDTPLWKYVHDVLHVDQKIRAYSVLKNCCLRHVKALWLLLSLERTKVLARSQQMRRDRGSCASAAESLDQYLWPDWFSGVDERYSQSSPEFENLKRTITSLPRLHCAQATNSVLEILYEFILLKLSTASAAETGSTVADDDEAFQPQYPLFETLIEYADALYSGNNGEKTPIDDKVDSFLKHLSTNLHELQLQHAVQTWVLILDISLSKAGGDTGETENSVNSEA